MPVEIKELIIRATVTTGPIDDPGADGGAGSDDKEAAVSAAVAEALRIMAARKER